MVRPKNKPSRYVNDLMLVRNYHQGSDWLPGEVLTTGSRNYQVKLSNGAVVRRHVDQMRNRTACHDDAPDATQQSTATCHDFDDFQPLGNSENSPGATQNSGTLPPPIRRSTQ